MLYPIGTKVRKFFILFGWYDGEIAASDKANKWHEVQHCDGDIEDDSNDEVSSIVLNAEERQRPSKKLKMLQPIWWSWCPCGPTTASTPTPTRCKSLLTFPNHWQSAQPTLQNSSCLFLNLRVCGSNGFLLVTMVNRLQIHYLGSAPGATCTGNWIWEQLTSILMCNISVLSLCLHLSLSHSTSSYWIWRAAWLSSSSMSCLTSIVLRSSCMLIPSYISLLLFVDLSNILQ